MKSTPIFFASLVLISSLSANAADLREEKKMASTADDIAELAPEFVKLTKKMLFKDIWERPGLSKRDKSLVTITTLAALNRIEQIDYHLGFGLDNGLTDKEIVAALTQLAFYAGWPAAMSGLTHLKKVLDERKSAHLMKILKPENLPSNPGPSDYFTGSVRVTPLVAGEGPSCLTCGSVAFQPGARSAWHTHPKGQLLIVTEGQGLIQEWGKPLRRIQKGDVIWTPPGVKHWHGAAPDTAMTHTAVTEVKDGKNVTWMEKVSEAEYQVAPQ